MFKTKVSNPSTKLTAILSTFNKTIGELEEVIDLAETQINIKKEEQKKIEDEVVALTLTSNQALTFRTNLAKLLGNK